VNGFTPTNRAPTSGLLGWSAPESNRTVTMRIGASVELEVMQRRDSWALVRGTDGATAWVDGNNLQPLTTRRRPNGWVALLIVIVFLALVAGGAYLYIRGRITQGEAPNTFGGFGLPQAPVSVLYG